MRWGLVSVMVSCGGDLDPIDAGPSDGPRDVGFDRADAADADARRCFQGSFPTFDDTCATSGDCAIGRHYLDCCGSDIAVGLRSSAKAQFDVAEKEWTGGCNLCGCMPMPTLTTSGDVCTMGYAPVIVECWIDGGGRCVTRCADGFSSDASDDP